MNPDIIISVGGVRMTLGRANALGVLTPDDLAALERPTELDGARAPMAVTVTRIESGPKSQRRRSRRAKP